MRGFQKPALQNLLLFVVSCLISLSITELSFRFFLFGWSSFSYEKVNSFNYLGESGVIQASPCSEVVFEFKPHLKTYFKLVPFITNSHGLRDKEYSFVKPEKTFRVAVIGDSYTMPAGVRIEDAYHTLLEDRYNATTNEKRFEFINFGVGGYNLRQYVGVIINKARYYSPDLYIIGFCARNDFMIDPPWLFEHPYEVPKQKYPFYQSFALSALLGLYNSSKTPCDNTKINEMQLSDDDGKYISELFGRLGDFSKTNNVPILLAYLDNRPRRCIDLENIIRQNEMYFCNLTLPFLNTNFKEYSICPIDSHPNDKANQLFAETLYTCLTTNTNQYLLEKHPSSN